MLSTIISGSQFRAMKMFYESGVTKPHTFRKQQLLALKAAILKYESDITAALYSDLKKSTEEAYATEIGLVLSDLNDAIKKLHKWMRPTRVKTNFLNFPSSSKLYHSPKGVVLIIGPWNYPFQLVMMPLIGAIAAGNCVVLKPSELAPATAAIIEQIVTETFSENFIKVYQGEGSEVVPALMQAFRFNHVFYTGSIAVGKIIYQLAAKELIPVTLELGGKSPAVVEADADLKVSARRIVLGKFINAGQTCVAPDYLLVHSTIFEKFIVELKSTLTKFYGEDAKKSGEYGKIVSEKRFDTLISYLQQGEIITGGRNDRSKLYIEPTLLINVPIESQIMKEEIFGPLLPIFSFNTMDEALSIIKENENPLAFYLFTSSNKKQQVWLETLIFGGGCINNTAWHLANPNLPFGGVGNSGIGAYHGKYSFDTFTHVKSVMKTPAWFDPSMKYPPFKGKLSLLKFLIK